jgi:hypothetical protein
MPVAGTKYMMMRKSIFRLRVQPQLSVTNFFKILSLQLAGL